MELVFVDCRNLLTGVEASELYRELNRGFKPKEELEKIDSFLVDTLYGPHNWDVGNNELKRPFEFKFRRGLASKLGISTCKKYNENAKAELDVGALEEKLKSDRDENLANHITYQNPLDISLTRTPYRSLFFSYRNVDTYPLPAEIFYENNGVKMHLGSSKAEVIYGIFNSEINRSYESDIIDLAEYSKSS